MAYHHEETRSANIFARHIERLFGFKGHLGLDVSTYRMQEVEADYIGLVVSELLVPVFALGRKFVSQYFLNVD